MYTVSEQYKNDINNLVRNPSSMRVRFGIVDPQAKDNATITDTSSAPYSNSAGIKDESIIPLRYDTLEHNQFMLDSSLHKLNNEVDVIFQGYVSNSFSNENCEFITPPKLIITYPLYFEYGGLSLYFDDVRNDFCSRFKLELFFDGTSVYNQTHDVGVVNFVLKEQLPLHNKMEITLLKTSLPYKRAKVSYLAFGVIQVYDDSSLTSTEQVRKVDILSTVLPTGDFNFTFLDVENDYNPENPTGLYAYVEQRQPVRFDYGYELNDGSTEWILGGTNFSTGDISFVSQGRIPSVTIKTSNSLAYLDEIYVKGTYNDAGKTLNQLALDVLSGRGVPYELDTSLNTITTKTPLPRDSIKNLLQLIANAGMCTLDVDRTGKITIKRTHPKVSVTQQDFKLDKTNSYNIPTVQKIPPLRNFITSYYNYTPKAVAEELSKIDVSGASNTEYLFDYPVATLVNLSVGAGLTIVGSVEYYAHGCKVVLTGTGTVTITGRKVDISEVSLTKSLNINGNDCNVSNQLITSSQNAKNYADWMSSVLLLNNDYTIENRGYPELDPMDKIYIDTQYTDDLSTIVVENNISFNGAIRATTKTIIAE